MILLIILICTEVLTPAVIRNHYLTISKVKYYIALLIHIVLSLWLWKLYIETTTYNGFYDDPKHIWLQMNLMGMICAVVFPRSLLIILHFAGRLAHRRDGYPRRWLTTIGIATWLFFLITIGSGTLYGRFNIKTENITLEIKGLSKDLEGLKIVQISDLHLATFYHHSHVLAGIMEKINSYNPDLILNTGDFVSYGWREYDGNDSILAIAKGKYGSYAVMGNHDFGTYHPNFTEADRANNVLLMNNKITLSGYKVLNDENIFLNIGNAKLALIGIITMGSHPNITYGNLNKALAGTDSADFKIFLSHDPNEWEKEVTGKTDIDLTLSGHTHGMQMGIITKKFSWSPSKYFYPHWYGLYRTNDQYHYVNRGLGVLAIPFRIWMPPEITLITLRSV